MNKALKGKKRKGDSNRHWRTSEHLAKANTTDLDPLAFFSS